MLGKVENNALLVFGLERICSLSITDHSFTVDKKYNADEVFDNIIGVTITNETVQEIILSFTPNQGKYIRSQPIHNSQEIVIDNETEFRIRLYLIPNYELKALILSYGNEAKVLEPKTLQNEIKEMVLSMEQLYR